MSSNIEKLERLAKLRDSGALSLSEFEAEKRKLLSADAPRSRSPLMRTIAIGSVITVIGVACFALWKFEGTTTADQRVMAPQKGAQSVSHSPPPAVTSAKAGAAAPRPAANPWVGEYEGTFEGDARGSLTIKQAAGGRLKFSLGIGAASCMGGLEADMAVLSDTQGVVAMPEDESGNSCRVNLKRDGRRITLAEEGCSYYHGFECSFFGTVKR